MPHRQTDTSSDAVLPHIADKRVVTIGGGTGSLALLSHLKDYPCVITAVVTMAESGGSSRRLMDEFGQLPFGDLRQALVALSCKEVLWRDVFTFRFGPGQALSANSQDLTNIDRVLHLSQRRPLAGPGVVGHSLGNPIVSALESINEGKLLWALEDAQEGLDQHTAGEMARYLDVGCPCLKADLAFVCGT